ncbi:uncharacterized protein TRIVIDRAFT_44704 [Trichoderma virens Gv29-8]|uniref:F-box domain-containing protein n=1 Tax=Hypocrea virens (strain Gv29-8 / FGSC 10586) TaxID=413071 RepID=G9N5F0_HYPVG|nr:uncharacterized protein TRIVIDRAFT_44704 [Trichoderma virens Gv29-8]EHK17995.1 hypothetical protein TRIVIDRAFT_44704 [Trichoderma virens Gv29-8]
MYRGDGQLSSRNRRSQRLIEARTSKKRLHCPNEFIHATILTLPVEILLLVITYLPSLWQFSLALTCKFFSELTHQSTMPRLEGRDLIEFLSTLQRDIPDLHFCYCCNKLCPLDSKRNWKSEALSETAGAFWHSNWWSNSYDDTHIRLPDIFRPFMLRSKISFMEANSVMSRYFHGPSHGRSLDSLARDESFEDVIELGKCIRFGRFRQISRRCRRAIQEDVDTEIQLPKQNLKSLPRKQNAWRFSFRSSPKIIDNMLYIARFYTIVGPCVTEENLKKFLNSISIPLCGHLTFSANPLCCYLMSSLPKRYLRSCPYIVPYCKDDRKAIEFDPEHDSCLLCSTDYDISLDRETNNETNINISIYHCLGACRTPANKLWGYFAGSTPCPTFEDSRQGRELKSRAQDLGRGCNRRKWRDTMCSE